MTAGYWLVYTVIQQAGDIADSAEVETMSGILGGKYDKPLMDSILI